MNTIYIIIFAKGQVRLRSMTLCIWQTGAAGHCRCCPIASFYTVTDMNSVQLNPFQPKPQSSYKTRHKPEYFLFQIALCLAVCHFWRVAGVGGANATQSTDFNFSPTFGESSGVTPNWSHFSLGWCQKTVQLVGN